MTEQEKNIIKNEIMDALLYGSKTIDQLTLSSDINDADLFEISGGRAITYSTLKATIAASITNGGGSGSGHTHANKDSLDQIATDSDGYIYLTYPKRIFNEATKEYETVTVTEKVKAGYADKAGDLTEDSPVLKLINTIGNQFVPTYLDGSTYVDTTWAEIVAGTRTLAAIKSVKGFFSDSFISARGANSAGGGSTGGAYYLYELLDTAISNPSSGQALVYNGSKWVNSTVEQNEYILPAASASTLGGVKVGATLAMANGVLDQKAGIVSEGVYPKVTVDSFGRVTAGELLAASDIPNLPWSKITSGTPTTIAGYGITDTYTKTDADNRYVQQSLFDSMFAKESDGNGGFRIKAKFGLYSDSFISARGVNPDGGGSGSGGVYYLHELLDAAINNPASGQALVYNGTKWVNHAIQTGLDEAALASYLTTHSYATQQWVESKGYLTTHQSLADYVTLNTPQNITANKAFYGEEKFIVGGGTYTDPWSGIACAIKVSGKVGITDSIKAASFIKANGTASQFLKADGSVDGNAYLTTASAAATYVSKAGDTMTGLLSVTRAGNFVGDFDEGIRVHSCGQHSWAAVVLCGTDNTGDSGTSANTWGIFAHDGAFGIGRNGNGITAGTARLWCDTSNVWRINGTNVLWHAGNDGAGSGLDADLLDGLHASSFVLDYGGEFSGKIYSLPCKSIFSGNNLSDAPVSGWVSGLVLGANWNNNHYQHYLVESNNGRWYTTRQSSNGSMTNWNTLAYLTDNVASATKLQTARTIWGQSFNGTANVSGSLTGVSSIGFNGNYELGIHNGRYVFGTTGQVGAVGANAGSLLVSNMWADATKVPTNGIYVKGDLRIGDITLSYDAANGGLHVSGGGLYADTYLSARGANTSGGGSTGGGLIQQVYGSSSLGGAFSDTTLTDTFNAYTINKIRTDLINADSALSGRITSLEGGAAVNVATTGSGNAITAISKSGTTIMATKGATFLTAHQSLANYVPWSKQSVATVNGTNHNPQFFNIENENLIANYKNYWSVINFGSYSGNNFRSQIAMPYQDSITDTDMFIRTANGSNWRAWRRVLHDGNYSSVLDSRYYTESEINAKLTNGSVSKVGTATVGSTAKGIYLNGGTPTALSATVGAANRPVYMNAGTITAGTYTFGNGSGNAPISNGSLCTNLNADLLDGLHNGALTARYLNLAAFVTNCNAMPTYNGIFSWGGTNSANPATYGVLLQWSSVDNPTPGTDQHWITQLASATSNRLFYRTRINTGAWSGWSAVAFTSDNVASATKLQTARTLWGQSFNGTANVDGALTVHHTGACGVYISGGGESSYSCQASGGLRWVSGAYPDRYFIWDSSGNGNERLTILNNGSVGIGTTSPSAKLDVIGVIHSTAGMWSNGYVTARGQNTASDARLKTILHTKLLDTKSIAAAPSVLFSWKDDGREDVGSIAQYWQRIDHHLVSHRPDGYLGLDYGKAALLSVISVAKQTLNHEARIKALEKENALLKKQIKSLT